MHAWHSLARPGDSLCEIYTLEGLKLMSSMWFARSRYVFLCCEVVGTSCAPLSSVHCKLQLTSHTNFNLVFGMVKDIHEILVEIASK